MGDDLLLHPRTKLQLVQLLQNKPNSILVSGVMGSGKETLSLYITALLLETTLNKLPEQAYFLHINPDVESITIDEIRSLQQFLKLKVPSHNDSINRVVLIQRAERMRSEAQNALLKTLEEPPRNTSIILTTHNEDILLKTITSRVQNLQILPVSEAQARDYFFNQGKKSENITTNYALSQGHVGLLSSLMRSEDHPLIQTITLAKNILAEPIGKRVLRTDEIAKDKLLVQQLLNALTRITHAALSASAKQHKASAILQWRKRQELVVSLQSKLQFNPNTKILLDELFLAL